ncbi:MAG: helix-turn-helix domain-containing protein [Fibromonadales bacterium]|nr:helix-turn-helix domain-containing protein [Fibromonadales bacterium]
MAKSKMSEKEYWESHGLKYYDTAWEAIGLSPEEAELEETKFQMARKIKELRSVNGITQTQLSKKMGTSQARIVALENAENTTLDSLFRAFRALGVSAREFGKMFGAKVSAT